MTDLPPIVSRALALALLMSVVLLGAVYVAMPLADRVRAADEALEFNRDLYARLSRSTMNRDAYNAQIEMLSARIGASGLYIRADTEPLAAAELQEQLKRAVSRHGGELRSVQGLPSEPEQGLTRIGLRVVMTGTLGPIIGTLYELEAGEPHLFVDNLQLKTTRQRRRRAEEEAVDLLSVRFDIVGYLPPETQ